MFQFQRNWSPLVLISRSSSFSVIQVIQTLRLSRKKESAFVVVVFISKRPGSYAIYRRNARVLKMQNFIPAYIRWCTYVRTLYGRFSQSLNFLDAQITKFSYQQCSAARAWRAQELPFEKLSYPLSQKMSYPIMETPLKKQPHQQSIQS